MTADSQLTVHDFLESLSEPSLVLDSTARVRAANRTAFARLACREEQELTTIVPATEVAEFHQYIRRCSGSRRPLPWTLTLRTADGSAVRFQCDGSLLAPAREGAPAMILLRISEGADERFATLARDVRRLNAELRERRRIQAALQDALRDRELMLRELHHRVKNNVQMLGGMISGERRESGSPEVRLVLTRLANRLEAIGALHQLLYRTESLAGVDAVRFVSELSATILAAYGARARLSSRATAGATIPNDVATPLALILNELLLNAIKHGNGDGNVYVVLSYGGGCLEVSVEDNGPGFELTEPAKRASGLGLVRGLARQLGGHFLIERSQGGGARCVVRCGIASDCPTDQELVQ